MMGDVLRIVLEFFIVMGIFAIAGHLRKFVEWCNRSDEEV